ncbi:hypothetical protein BCR33DRAFT_717807 [Rhizoclosmatium globosum]|uniref:Integral membrane protein n=1 Tax=Rhizoclosmatium globosum TaxID=329046 RepID=A0A1Y2C9S8_9FUNG|nr:hypothetical protein BCR33DRAFT_717807 [Rhizoclosmatium globosum]|eukprot:ORY43075.1 hypothetical protein BCR33DRAFT_717807 [Rhizoclosmatium globosum]
MGRIDILISIIAPPVIYSIASNQVPSWQAYLYCSIPIFLLLLWEFYQTHTLGLFATPTIIGITAQVVVAYVWGSSNQGVANLCIVFPQACVGIMWLLSLTWKRNAIALLARGDTPESIAESDARWQYPGYRWATAFMCIVWGISFLSAATVVAICGFLAPQSAFTGIQLGVGIGTPVLVGVWQYFYILHLKKRAAQAATSQEPFVQS